VTFTCRLGAACDCQAYSARRLEERRREQTEPLINARSVRSTRIPPTVFPHKTDTFFSVSQVDTKKFDDKYFKKPSKDRSKKSETDFFEEKTEKKELPASYVADNKALDAAIAPKVAAVPHLAGTYCIPKSLVRARCSTSRCLPSAAFMHVSGPKGIRSRATTAAPRDATLFCLPDTRTDTSLSQSRRFHGYEIYSEIRRSTPRDEILIVQRVCAVASAEPRRLGEDEK